MCQQPKDASAAVKVETGLDIVVRVIGPRRDYEDHTGDWARAREIQDSGCILVRPDQHVAWRANTVSSDAKAELLRVVRSVLSL